MPRVDFEKKGNEKLKTLFEKQKKASYNKEVYENQLNYLSNVINNNNIKKEIVKHLEDARFLNYLLEEVGTSIQYIKDIEIDIQTYFENNLNKKPLLENQDLIKYIVTNMSLTTIESISTSEQLTEALKLCQNYLKELSAQESKPIDYLDFLVQNLDQDIEVSILRSDTLKKYRDYLIEPDNRLLRTSLIEAIRDNELIKRSLTIFKKTEGDALTRYIMREMDLEEISSISNLTKLSEAYTYLVNYCQIKREKLGKFFSEHENDFIFVGEQEIDFSEALENGNLKKLLYLCRNFPNEYENELCLQENFNENLKKKFQTTFQNFIKKGNLEEFVQNYLGEEIVEKFNKDKEGKPDFQAFIKNVKNLKNKDNFLDILLDIFYQLISYFGFEIEVRNSSKERLYSNILEVKDGLFFVARSTNIISNDKEQVSK